MSQRTREQALIIIVISVESDKHSPGREEVPLSVLPRPQVDDDDVDLQQL